MSDTLKVKDPDALVERAATLATDGAGPEASASLAGLAGNDRLLVEAARDRAAARVRVHVDDWEATAALQLLNRVLADLPRTDPLDWQVRWKQHRKP
ncbi:MAG TPA: hypothetical protein VFV02_13035 [Acidimicrobiales bacterium]|nr:hypothetical protein [Acidimicrobiales bacterium]